MKKIINYLLGLEDIKWFLESGLSDEQKIHARHLLQLLLIRAVAIAGLSGALGGYALLTAGANATNTTLIAGQPTDTNIVVPSSPGNTSALDICKNGIVEKGTTHIDGGSRSEIASYSAVLGPERISYVDNPPGGKNLVVILNGNPQTVQSEVIECLIKRAK
jgi:hypothetical protein